MQVLAKAGAVLDHLAAEQELTAAQLAELLSEPRSTVYRLLGSLESLGLVEARAGHGTYRLGLKLFRLGSAVVARFDERQAALPVMDRIHQETGETVFLCVRREWHAVCIERIDGKRVQSLELRLGGALPLHAGAAPRVLLAYEPRPVWKEYLSSGPLASFTPRTPVHRTALFPYLEEVCELGYSISDEDVTMGIGAVGAPIFDHRGEIRAALSLSGVRSEVLEENTDDMVALIVEGANEISQAIGHDGAAKLESRV